MLQFYKLCFLCNCNSLTHHSTRNVFRSVAFVVTVYYFNAWHFHLSQKQSIHREHITARPTSVSGVHKIRCFICRVIWRLSRMLEFSIKYPHRKTLQISFISFSYNPENRTHSTLKSTIVKYS